MAFAKGVFRKDFHCPRCGAGLFVSVGYGRTLMVVSLIIGFSLVWVVPISRWLIPVLGPLLGFTAVLASGFPLAFAVLFFMLRLVPLLLPPPLVLKRDDAITSLGLSSEPDN